jgi:hypothetical protein
MTLAEIVLVVAGVVGIYLLLRPVQRRLERYLHRKFTRLELEEHLPTIDITDFKSHRSHRSHQKEDEDHDIDS